MRRAARVDENQAEIVAALQSAGCWVLDLSAVGKGCPDLLVHEPYYPWNLRFIEVKNPRKPKRDQALTAQQVKFHAGCKAPLSVVTDVDDALRAMGIRA